MPPLFVATPWISLRYLVLAQRQAILVAIGWFIATNCVVLRLKFCWLRQVGDITTHILLLQLRWNYCHAIRNGCNSCPCCNDYNTLLLVLSCVAMVIQRQNQNRCEWNHWYCNKNRWCCKWVLDIATLTWIIVTRLRYSNEHQNCCYIEGPIATIFHYCNIKYSLHSLLIVIFPKLKYLQIIVIFAIDKDHNNK